MTITLRPDQEEAIARAIESGVYRNADQVIERALEILRSEDEWLLDRKYEINRKIDSAFRQFGLLHLRRIESRDGKAQGRVAGC
jgi:Arc/MetJ-type ribon-helix-helix transcriptional regulator